MKDLNDRPEVFFGMTCSELERLHTWLARTAPQINAAHLAQSARTAYTRGVELGLNAVGMGHSLLPGAAPLSRPWVDALGREWQWDAVNLEPVSHHLEVRLDDRDFSDLPCEDFILLARGLLDSVVACGWAFSDEK